MTTDAIADANASDNVNPHYLGHVVKASQSHAIGTSEDVVSASGVKLLARGARIDAGVRERLLAHKLRRPLEQSVGMDDDAITARLAPTVQTLLDKHALLRALCADGPASDVPAAIAAVTLAPQPRALLAIYTQLHEDRLEHAVGVAMLAVSLGRRLQASNAETGRVLATAGLLHDVGELYIDPEYLRRGARLTIEQWRHIVVHPLVGHRVLRDMAGAGSAVADAVLLHHERLDGFGYPRGVAGEAFTRNGQILAVAEWLMAIIESGASPLTRARMAERLVPGEFSPTLLHAVSAGARAAPDAPVDLEAAAPLEQAAQRIEHLIGVLERFRQARGWIDARIAQADGELRRVLDIGLRRMLVIQASFSSAGLDAQAPAPLLAELAALRDPSVYTETVTLVEELEWRIREVARQQRLRGGLLPPAEAAVVAEWIDRVQPASLAGRGA